MSHSLLGRATLFVRLMVIPTVLAGIAPTMAQAETDDVNVLVSVIKAATARFEDVNVALAEGYIPDPSGHCIDAAAEGLPPEWGAMGIHYIHPAALGLAAGGPRVDGNGLNTDFLKPSILLYEPQADGSLKLVGVENLVFETAWKAAGHAEGPSLGGRKWDHMVDDAATAADEAHGFMPHYDQHVWFVDNPAGRLNPFNPAVTCAHHPARHAMNR